MRRTKSHRKDKPKPSTKEIAAWRRQLEAWIVVKKTAAHVRL
jgi:hypothetical protein